MHRTVLLFNGDGTTTLTEEPLPALSPDEVIIETIATLVSAGTERLVLNGNVDDSLADTTAEGAGFTYPRPYGYCCVGRVVQMGGDVSGGLSGQRVFGFLPHATHHVTNPEALYVLPDTLDVYDATFIPNVETALSIVWDAQVGPGSRVVLIGVGGVGTLVAQLLQQVPALDLVVVDTTPTLNHHTRLALSVHRCPTDTFDADALPESWRNGPDVVIELSSVPAMLQRALDVSGPETRVVLGSWYGSKPVSLDLGSDFHRKRLTMAATPVSTLPARRKTRWSKSRQLHTAMQLAADLDPAANAQHTPFRKAPSVYASIADNETNRPQIFTYRN